MLVYKHLPINKVENNLNLRLYIQYIAICQTSLYYHVHSFMHVIMYLDLCETHWAFCDKVKYWSDIHIYITSDSGSDGRKIENCYGSVC